MKGPNPSQSWTFSTNVVFRFSYTGWGLSRGDTLRIIETDAKSRKQLGAERRLLDFCYSETWDFYGTNFLVYRPLALLRAGLNV